MSQRAELEWVISREIFVAPIVRPTRDPCAVVQSEVGQPPPSNIRLVGDNADFTVGGRGTCPRLSAAQGRMRDLP